MKTKDFFKYRKLALNPAKISIRNVFAVLQSWMRRKKEIMGFELPTHIYEQIIWRRVQVMINSPKCWSQNACVQCGCDVLGKTMEDRNCEGGCYPTMMNKQNWESYKRIHKINLFE